MLLENLINLADRNSICLNDLIRYYYFWIIWSLTKNLLFIHISQLMVTILVLNLCLYLFFYLLFLIYRLSLFLIFMLLFDLSWHAYGYKSLDIFMLNLIGWNYLIMLIKYFLISWLIILMDFLSEFHLIWQISLN